LPKFSELKVLLATINAKSEDGAPFGIRNRVNSIREIIVISHQSREHGQALYDMKQLC
jgi:hypothetical protein